MSYLYIFVLALAIDFGWAKYTQAVTRPARLLAACWSAALYALSLLVILDIVDRPGLLLAACAGAFVGTLLGTGEAVP